jgi:hypothetical protein
VFPIYDSYCDFVTRKQAGDIYYYRI